MSGQLNDEQLKRIAATLKRIRGGLSKAETNQFSEPAHTFNPEAQIDVKK
jgi:hypothetical protein